MWVAKFTIETSEWKDAVVDKHAKENNISAIGYPLARYQENGKYFFTTAGFISGTDSNVANTISALKKDKRVKNLELKDDLVVLNYEGNAYVKELYDPHFINVSPVKIDPNGTETWEIGSWERERLSNLIAKLKKKYKIKLLNLSQRKLNQLSFLQVVPQLTEKQKRALILAINRGYYEMPRKIELEELARLMGISFSTYRQHLRKGEEKFFQVMKTAL